MSQKSSKNWPRIPKLPPAGNLMLVGAGIVFLIFLFWPRTPKEEIKILPYSQFLQDVDAGRVSRVKVGDKLILYQLKPSPLEPQQDLLDTIPNDTLGDLNQSNNPLHAPSAGEALLPSSQDDPSKLLATIPLNDPQLPERLEKKGVIFEASLPQQSSWIMTVLAW